MSSVDQSSSQVIIKGPVSTTVCVFDTRGADSRTPPYTTWEQLRNNSLPMTISVSVDRCPLTMESDKRPALSRVTGMTFKEFWPDIHLSSSKVCLYGEAIPVIGSMDTTVKFKGQAAQLPLIVVKGKRPSSFGKNWLKHLGLDRREIHHVQNCSLETVLVLLFSQGSPHS